MSSDSQSATTAPAAGDPLFEALIAVAVDGIIVTDEQGIILVYNGACERLFGHTQAEVLGRELGLLMPEPYRSDHFSYMHRFRATGEKRIIGIGREVMGQRKDGSTFPMYISIGEGRLESSRIFVGIVHDISDRKARERRIEELQRDLSHVTRLSAMGQLSTAIAHELNQPLGASLNYANAAQHLLSHLPGEEAARASAAVEKAAQQIVRAGEIIGRLREFVEKREQHRTTVDINEVVRDAVALSMIGTVGAAIHLLTDLAPDIPPVSADRIQLQQVLVNLMLNAVDALQDATQPQLRIETALAPGGMIRVSVVDNGRGLSEETRQSLFQPFATTKSNGMGIGLSICRTIVEAHGGKLWAETAPEGGAVFRFALPVQNDAETA